MIGVPATISNNEQITITVSSSSRTNTTVTVTIDDGEDDERTVMVQLDANGNGSANWTVPADWEVANFNDGVCVEETRDIDQS